MPQSYRAFIEVAPDVFVHVHDLYRDPNKMVGAVEVLRGQLREILGGLAPALGPDVLLNLCREVIEEDR